VVVGAQRAGSTHLAATLEQHPGLYVCPDEVPFFEDPFFGNSDPAALVPVFAAARPDQRLGIHCPSYLGHGEVAARLVARDPGVRVLAVLREPVARAVSLYFWYVQFGMLPLEPLATGMDRLLDGWSDPAYPHAHEVIDWGLYGKHWQRYVDVFSPDQLLVLLIGELDDPGAWRRVFAFLDVDSAFSPEPHLGPKNAGVYDLRRLRWLRTRERWAWSWQETTSYEYRPRRLRKPVRFLLNGAVVGLDRYVLARVFGNDVPTLPPATEARLRARYTDDISHLESLLARDLSSWRQPASG
jgi:hypothetical protein